MPDAKGVSLPEASDLDMHKVLQVLCRHLVALCVNYQKIDLAGQLEDGGSFYACAGTILSIRGVWNYLTAGHVLQNLDEAIQNPRVQINSAVLADTFGPEIVSDQPIPFDLENARRFFLQDDEEGLDFGLIALGDYYRRLLERNGILAISEENWVHQHRVDFDTYTMLGFPDEFSTEEVLGGQGGQTITGTIAPTMIPLKRLEEPPKGTRTTKYPRFVGQLSPGFPLTSLKGMSGGPIFGFKKGDSPRYWVIAIQSGWLRSRRTIFGCPVPVLAGLIDTWLRGFESKTEFDHPGGE